MDKMQNFQKNLNVNIEPIVDYLVAITNNFSSITSIWLLGSRANNTARPDSDWDLFVFADEDTFNKIKENENFHNPLIDLLVIYNGNDFANPYGGQNGRKKKQGSLEDWEWEEGSVLSIYEAKKLRGNVIKYYTKKAVKIWTANNE